jgi:hypothetical protein
LRFTRDIRSTIELDHSPGDVWASLEDIERHVEWMADAVAITFITEQRRGVGTRFVCDTKVGPFRLSDDMEITIWTPGTEMGVAHRGIVTGSGSFQLAPLDVDRRCRLIWSETLSFPWWMGGPIGASIGARVLGRIWRRNLARLERDLDGRR